MVDAADLKSADLAVVGVQVSPWAPPHVVPTGVVVLAGVVRISRQRRSLPGELALGKHICCCSCVCVSLLVGIWLS